MFPIAQTPLYQGILTHPRCDGTTRGTTMAKFHTPAVSSGWFNDSWMRCHIATSATLSAPPNPIHSSGARHLPTLLLQHRPPPLVLHILILPSRLPSLNSHSCNRAVKCLFDTILRLFYRYHCPCCNCIVYRQSGTQRGWIPKAET